jgi:hypothetical protein
VYEGGHRVPLIVSAVGPHGSHLLEAVAGGPGAAATATVGLVDLFATTRALLGEAADDDGRAFPAAGADRVIGSQSFDGSLVLIWGSQKAVFSSGSGGFSDPVGVPCAPDSTVGQFFDLGPDPRETANLWQASSQAVRAMASDFAGATRFEWTPTLPRRRERRTSAPDGDAPVCGARARRFARISTAPAAASNGQNSGTSPHSTYVRATCQTGVHAGFSVTGEADEIGETV